MSRNIGVRRALRLSLAGGLALLAVLVLAGPASAGRHRVLRVGTFHHVRGRFRSIQAAVDAARPGDWILIAPGIYHEQADRTHTPAGSATPNGYATSSETSPPPAGVVITTPRIHLRGLGRNRVIIDGTLPHRGPACSADPNVQDYGVKGSGGTPLGRNGIVVWKASGVSIENLTVCNFLTGSAASGNEIWWNGGDGTGTIGLGGFRGAYLNATSTFYKDEATAAAYGIFSSNASGPGLWTQTYTSNFNDSGYYIGACQQLCRQTLDHGHAQFSALGYSGTNSGGSVLVKNSEFDQNEDGFDTNSQNNSDAPSPQDGACPAGGTSRITHTHSCWVFMDNFVHDNNNPNVPSSGAAAAGPVGTGMSISGGRNDTVVHNRFVHNGAWGVIFVPYPDTETPPPIAQCQGGSNLSATQNPYGVPVCWYNDWGNSLLNNKFSGNGFYGNPTNGDFAEITFDPGNPGLQPLNCEVGNTMPDGSSPPNNDPGFSLNTQCGAMGPQNGNAVFTNEVACDSQLLGTPCLPTDSYPRRTQVVMHPLPTQKLKSMPKPCAGIPRNPWCARR